MPLSFNQRRLVAGIAALACVLSVANYCFFHLQLLEPYKKAIVILSYVFAALVLRYVAPTLSEMVKHRASRRSTGQ